MKRSFALLLMVCGLVLVGFAFALPALSSVGIGYGGHIREVHLYVHKAELVGASASVIADYVSTEPPYKVGGYVYATDEWFTVVAESGSRVDGSGSTVLYAFSYWSVTYDDLLDASGVHVYNENPLRMKVDSAYKFDNAPLSLDVHVTPYYTVGSTGAGSSEPSSSPTQPVPTSEVPEGVNVGSDSSEQLQWICGLSGCALTALGFVQFRRKLF